MPIYGTKNVIIEEVMFIHLIEFPMKRVDQMWIRSSLENNLIRYTRFIHKKERRVLLYFAVITFMKVRL